MRNRNWRLAVLDLAERVPATLDEYEEVRSEGNHFLLVPGHEDTEVERVVKPPHTHFAVVEKFNAVVARIGRGLDPRIEPT